MKPRILLLGTGGTIASVQTEDGLTPEIPAEALLSYVPEAREVAEVDAMQILNLDSTNIETSHWEKMARRIEEHYDDYDGFVLCHGTDTMAYTSAALSYLIQNSPKPIILTGSQKPINLDTTDARSNLMDSIRFAADPRAHDVNLVFGGNAICGTRVQKERTKSFNAFVSVNFPYVASIQDERIFLYIDDKAQMKHGKDKVRFEHKLMPSVGLVKLIPSMPADVLEDIGAHFRAIVIESFGVGGLPVYQSSSHREAVERLVRSGHTVVMTTQVPYEGSDMSVYAVGKNVKEDLGLWEAYDMTLPAVITKLMWILAKEKTREEAWNMFRSPINRDTLWTI